MRQSKFRADLQDGAKGEKHVANTLKRHYGADKVTRAGACKGFDFGLIYKDDDIEFFEVKTDFRAKTTGNLFFEYQCSGKDSGLAATSADKWAVLLPHMQIILVFEPSRMFTYLKKSPKAREIIGGDRKAVRGYVIPIKVIMDKVGVEKVLTKTRLTKAET